MPAHDEYAAVFEKHAAWPSPIMIGFLGALGLRLRERRRGAKGDPRIKRAIEEVVEHLGPFLDAGPSAGKPVLPKLYGDDRFATSGARKAPVTLKLAAEVAIYLSAPAEEDEESRGLNRDDLFTSPSHLEVIADRIGEVVSAQKSRELKGK